MAAPLPPPPTITLYYRLDSSNSLKLILYRAPWRFGSKTAELVIAEPEVYLED